MTTWPPFCIRHMQTHFCMRHMQTHLLNVDTHFSEVNSRKPNYRLPKRQRQSINWSYFSLVNWCWYKACPLKCYGKSITETKSLLKSRSIQCIPRIMYTVSAISIVVTSLWAIIRLPVKQGNKKETRDKPVWIFHAFIRTNDSKLYQMNDK